MCEVCEKVTAQGADVASSLDAIAARVRAGTPAEHFKDAMDVLLGTEEPEVDLAVNRAWEKRRRASQ